LNEGDEVDLLSTCLNRFKYTSDLFDRPIGRNMWLAQIRAEAWNKSIKKVLEAVLQSLDAIFGAS
jgi:hypothetical protein